MINTILFLGTQKSGSSRDALKAAKELGYYVCLFTNNIKQVAERNEYPEVDLVRFCDLSNIDDVRKSIKSLDNVNLEVKAIVSFIDPFCSLATQLAKEFNVENFTPEASYLMQNKMLSRMVMKNTYYSPRYFVITEENQELTNEIENMLPVVVKYIDSNGSKDVYYCDSMELYNKFTKKLFQTYPGGTLIVEEYLDGPQYIVEIMVINQTINIIAVIQQEIDFINEHFIITGYNLLHNYSSEFNHKLRRAVETIVVRHKLKNGPCHLEIRYVDRDFKLVEANPRISGAGMNRLLKVGLGIDLVKETLKLALHQEVDIKPKIQKYTSAKYIIVEKEGILKRVTGKEAAINSPGVKFIYVKPRKGNLLTLPISLGNRYAYVIATGHSLEDARDNAIEGANKIQFHYDE